MKTQIPPVRSNLQVLKIEPLLENEQSAALATHAAPRVPLPLTSNVGDPMTSAVVVLVGTEGNDTITGTDSDEQIQGLGGDDVLITGAGNDTVLGGAGNDTLYAGRLFSAGDVPPPIGPTDRNTLFGGADDDYLYGDEGIDVLSGDDGNDVLQDDNGDDFLYGGAGNDRLNGGSGADILDGGDGYDIVSFGYSNSISIDLTKASSTWTGDALGDVFTSIEEFQLSGSSDVFVGAGGNDVVLGRGGNDTVSGGSSDDNLDGGSGDDVLNGGDGNDILRGGVGESHFGRRSPGGNDSLNGGNGADTLDGGDDNDLLDGGAGADTLTGGDGSDTASYLDATVGISIDLTKASSTWTGDAQGDVFNSIESIVLSDFADTFRGDANVNIVNGANGDDQIFGAGGDDDLNGSNGNDTIQGGDGNDFVRGDGYSRSPGDDYLQGNAGDDVLFGDGGNDRIVGGIGNDTLRGGLGGDYLVGSEGADIFQYTAVEESQSVLINGVLQHDQINDFTQGQDKIDLSGIDANPTLDGDQAFTFITDPAHYTGDWTGVVWQTTDPRSGVATINVSIDGDADAEMQIYMSHPYQFTANDFIL
jgi:Ca2+-binding RTX toxin-like protein